MPRAIAISDDLHIVLGRIRLSTGFYDGRFSSKLLETAK